MKMSHLLPMCNGQNVLETSTNMFKGLGTCTIDDKDARERGG